MMKQYTTFIPLVLVAILIVGAIVWLDSQKAETGEGDAAVVAVNSISNEEKASMYEQAKEITTPDGFINTDGITVQELIGKQVILVDFWTYSCINCQRTTPYLNSWNEKYGDKGLTILGIHTPEFEFEKEYDNVARAVEKFGIKYPVILDNDYSTWRAYENRYWPHKYLIDIDGYIVYDHIGEGGYEETEDKIVELLNERNVRLGESQIVRDMNSVKDADTVDFSRVNSPEMYFGSDRLKNLGNTPGLQCLPGVCVYEAVEEPPLNTFFFDGTWRVSAESATLESSTGAIVLTFSANKVNFVAGADIPVSAQIYLDGKQISPGVSGDAVADSKVVISDEDLYNLVNLKGDYGTHTLRIEFESPGVHAFTFTFG